MAARVGRVAMALGIVLVLGFYAELLAHAPVAGADFRVFYAAATVVHQGGNPYDLAQLMAAERALYRLTAAQRASLPANPYVSGPLLAVSLVPLTALPPATAYALYAALMGIVALVALALLAALWPAVRSRRRAALLLCSPVTYFGLLMGQPDALLLLLVALALRAARPRPWLAGALMGVGLIKLQVMAGPLLLLGLYAGGARNARGVLAYAAGALAGLLLCIGAGGPGLAAGWARAVLRFGSDNLHAQPDIASLSTFYLAWAPRAPQLLAGVAGIALWVGACARWWQGWRRENAGATGRGRGNRRLAILLTAWLLVTPYAHPYDDVLALPAVWYLLERWPHVPPARRRRLRPLAMPLALCWWLLPLTGILGLHPPIVRGLGVIPMLLLLSVLLAMPKDEAVEPTDRAIGAYSIAS